MAGRHFFITGLPRSRTNWLSVFFTYGRSICLHDALREAENMKELREMLAEEPAEFTGDSDSGIPKNAREFMTEFPDAPLLIIDRAFFASARSSSKKFGLSDDKVADETRKLTDGIAQLRTSHGNVLVIPYDGINDEAIMRVAWAHLLPGVDFPERRFRFLRTTRVDLVPETYIRSITSRAVLGV